jgi:hypothetical protein
VALDGEIFDLVVVEDKDAEQARPYKEKGKKAPKLFNHLF